MTINQLSSKNKLLQTILVISLLGLGLLLRLFDLTDPPLDFHPTRQLRGAIIARGMYYQMLPSSSSELRDTAISLWKTMEAYEPPIFERIVAVTYLIVGSEHIWIARIYSSIFWLVGGFALFKLAQRLTSYAGAIFSLTFYLILPFSVVASRTFQPDPFMVMWVLLAVLGLYRWVESDGKSWAWAALGGLSTGLAILLKVTVVFPILGTAIGLAFTLPSLKSYLKNPQTYLIALLSGLLPAIYYLSIPGGQSTEFFMFWNVALSRLLTDRKFYVQWLGLIRGLMDWGIFFAGLLGIFLFNRRGNVIAAGLWVGYLLLGLSFPYQISTHEYYSLILVPIVALSLAPFANFAWQKISPYPLPWKIIFLLITLTIASYYAYIDRSVLVAQDYRQEPQPWIEMGKNLPTDGKMVALTHDVGNRLKYYGWRTASVYWPSVADFKLSEAAGQKRDQYFQQFFNEQTKGMRYFLVTLFGDLDAQPELKSLLYDHYEIAGQGDGYILFDLQKPK
jgi:hypothetical protein